MRPTGTQDLAATISKKVKNAAPKERNRSIALGKNSESQSREQSQPNELPEY